MKMLCIIDFNFKKLIVRFGVVLMRDVINSFISFDFLNKIHVDKWIFIINIL